MSIQQPTKVSIPDSLQQVTRHWAPKRVASLNDAYDVRIVKVAGEFVWHSHTDTDELFYILSGDLTIHLCEPGNEQTKDLQDIQLSAGEMVVIPKGVRHRPVTNGQGCAIMVLEPIECSQHGGCDGHKGAQERSGIIKTTYCFLACWQVVL
jgi:mannose-6-phosphate isomerase-like protein (cupin superfamily)